MFFAFILLLSSCAREKNEDIFVPWTYILVFIGCFMILTTLGKLNAFLGVLGVGFVLILAGSAITGMQRLFANYTWWEGPLVIVVGSFVIALAIIGLIGGVEVRRY